MAKDIVAKLKELRIKTRSKESAIIECKEEIRQGLDAGFSIKEIWLVLKQSGQTTHSYSGFVKAVNKHIMGTDRHKITPEKKNQNVADAQKSASPDKPGSKPVFTATRLAVPVPDEKTGHTDPNDDDETIETDEAAKKEALSKFRKGKKLTVDEQREYVITGKRPE